MKLFAYIFMILLYSTGLSYGQIFNNFSTVRSVKNYFVENKGQWSSEVLFLAETKNMNVWITGNSLIFDIFKVNHFPYNDQKRTINPKSPADSEVISGYVVKMKLSVSNNSQIFSEKIILPGNPLDRYNNYFIGNNPEHWASNVQLYDSVYIQHYIPGMDLKLYFDEGKFRYDLICHPGIDPNNIVFGFEGQDDISLIENNTFSLETGIGKLFHGDLSTYQPSAGKNFEVNSGFRLISENEVGLVVGIFDPTKDFIIDPLVYSSYLGG